MTEQEPLYSDAILALLAILNGSLSTAGHHLNRHKQGALIRLAAAAAQLSVLALQIAVEGPQGGNGRGPDKAA